MKKPSPKKLYKASLEFNTKQMRKLKTIAGRCSISVKELVQRVVNVLFPV